MPVVTLRLWTLRVHPFNDEGCAPSTKRSPIRPFAGLPNESANCARPGDGHRNAWPKRRICIAPMWVASSAASGTCLCGTSRSSRTHSAFRSLSCSRSLERFVEHRSLGGGTGPGHFVSHRFTVPSSEPSSRAIASSELPARCISCAVFCRSRNERFGAVFRQVSEQ